MYVQETNEIRELTAAELEEVTGGHAGIVICGLLFIAAMDLTVDVLEGRNLWEQAVAYHKSL